MTKVTRMGVLLAFVLGGIAAGTAVADDENTADDLEAWGTISTDELGETRGGTATADGQQDATQTITTNGGAVNGGNIDMSNLTDNSIMSNTIINSGNNVVLMNTMAIDICLSCDVTINP